MEEGSGERESASGPVGTLCGASWHQHVHIRRLQERDHKSVLAIRFRYLPSFFFFFFESTELNSIQFTAKANWSTVRQTGTPPPPRQYHSTVRYKDFMYVFGGQDGHHFNDFYRFNFRTFLLLLLLSSLLISVRFNLLTTSHQWVGDIAVPSGGGAKEFSCSGACRQSDDCPWRAQRQRIVGRFRCL